MSRRRTSTDELWHGYRRPVRSDRALWVAMGLSVVFVVIEFALASPSTPLGWLAFVLTAVAAVVVVTSLVGLAAGVFRGFADGWRSNRARSGATKAEPPGPTTGAARAEPDPASAPDPEPSPADDGPTLPRPAVPESVKNLAASAQAHKPTSADVDRTARALGRAAGAAKRAYRRDD